MKAFATCSGLGTSPKGCRSSLRFRKAAGSGAARICDIEHLGSHRTRRDGINSNLLTPKVKAPRAYHLKHDALRCTVLLGSANMPDIDCHDTIRSTIFYQLDREIDGVEA